MPIDLNADLGEERGDDAALMPFITSANIACGGHAGTPETMRRTVDLALRYGVAIGAHPGYPDRASFGRSVQDLSPPQLIATLLEQIDALATIAAQAGAAVFHVKPHGALYNHAARDPETAAAIVEAIKRYQPGLALVGLAGSRLTAAGAAAGLRIAHEAFVDRAYEADGTLRDRTLPGAVLDSEDQARQQALDLALHGRVRAWDGSLISLRAHTLCIHGDTPHALRFARIVRTALDQSVTVKPLAAIIGP